MTSSVEKLQPIRWFCQNMIAEYKIRIIKVGDMLWRVHTLGNLAPGTFGLRIKTGTTGGVLLANSLPYTNVVCDADSGFSTLPARLTNPQWLNLHFTTFWGSANQDNIFTCVKPDEMYQYRYTIDPIHPTGLGTIHSNNFSSSAPLDELASFPVHVYNSDVPDYPCCPNKYQEEFLFIHVPLLESCSTPIVGCGYNYSFITPSGPNPMTFQLTNGQISPTACYPTDKLIIFRIAWIGIQSPLRLSIIDDTNAKINFRVLSLDSIPIKSCDVQSIDNWIFTDYTVAITQSVDIGVVFTDSTRKYSLVNNSFPLLPPLLNIETYVSEDIIPESKCTESGPLLSITQKNCVDLYSLKLGNNELVKNVSKTLKFFSPTMPFRSFKYSNSGINLEKLKTINITASSGVQQITMVPNVSEIWELILANSLGPDSVAVHTHLMWFLVLAYRDSSNDPWTSVPSPYWENTIQLDKTGRSYLIWVFPFANEKQPEDLQAIGYTMLQNNGGNITNSYLELSLFIDNSSLAVPAGNPATLGPIPMPAEVANIVIQAAQNRCDDWTPCCKNNDCEDCAACNNTNNLTFCHKC